MDKQREKFYKAFPRHEGILELNDAGTIEYFDALALEKCAGLAGWRLFASPRGTMG